MLAVSRYMNLASKLVWSYSISIVMILLTVMFMINILRGILFQWLLSDGAISVGFQNLKMQLTAENFGTKKGPLRGVGRGYTCPWSELQIPSSWIWEVGGVPVSIKPIFVSFFPISRANFVIFMKIMLFKKAKLVVVHSFA